MGTEESFKVRKVIRLADSVGRSCREYGREKVVRSKCGVLTMTGEKH
jgi:hypothetical protein